MLLFSIFPGPEDAGVPVDLINGGVSTSEVVFIVRFVFYLLFTG